MGTESLGAVSLCQSTFFFKQWGGVQKKRAGRILEGLTYDEYPPIHRMPFPEAGIRRTVAAKLEQELSETNISQSRKIELPLLTY
jgi:hypothetical protein